MSSGQQTGFIYAKSILFYLSTFAFVILIKMHQNASIYTVLCANINCIFSKFFHWVFTNALTFSLKPIHQEKRGFGILLTALCILLRYKECRQRSEHINPKIATFGTFLNILFHHPGEYSLWYLFCFFVLWLPMTLSVVLREGRKGGREAFDQSNFRKMRHRAKQNK